MVKEAKSIMVKTRGGCSWKSTTVWRVGKISCTILKTVSESTMKQRGLFPKSEKEDVKSRKSDELT